MTSAQNDLAVEDEGTAPHERREPSYLHGGYRLRDWLTTRDHKRIAVLYALSITFFFFLGGVAAALIRLAGALDEGERRTVLVWDTALHGAAAAAVVDLAGGLDAALDIEGDA